jgi:hypothetical protein
LYPLPEDKQAVAAALNPQGEASFPAPIKAAKPTEKTPMMIDSLLTCRSKHITRNPTIKMPPPKQRRVARRIIQSMRAFRISMYIGNTETAHFFLYFFGCSAKAAYDWTETSTNVATSRAVAVCTNFIPVIPLLSQSYSR